MAQTRGHSAPSHAGTSRAIAGMTYPEPAGRRWSFLAGRRTKRTQGASAALFLTPACVAFAIFVVTPAVLAIGLSFYRWDMATPPTFAGLANWRGLADDGRALQALGFTTVYVAVSVPLTVLVGMTLAVLLHGLNRVARIVLQSIFFAPAVSSTLAMSLVWKTIYGSDTGLLNYIFSFAGLPRVNWLGSSTLAPLAVVLMSVWAGAGYSMLIYLARLQALDRTIYEAAAIDGAGPWATLSRVTVPLLSPLTFFIAVVATITGLQAFEQVYLLTQGGPGYATTTIVYFIVDTAFTRLNVGEAAAMSIVLFLFIGLVTLLQWRLQRRWVSYE